MKTKIVTRVLLVAIAAGAVALMVKERPSIEREIKILRM